jgi:hypothetical protein
VVFAVVDPLRDPPVDPCPVSSDPNAPIDHEATIASIVPSATPLHPWGALKLLVPPEPEADPFRLRCLAAELAKPDATVALVGSAAVRGSGLVLTGSFTGYAGRPPLLTKADVDAGTPEAKRYDLAWAEESGLAGEALVLARKARRFFYPYDRPCRPPSQPGDPPPTCYGPYPELTDPLAPGPVLGFIAGPLCSGIAAICPPARLSELQRGSTLQFFSVSGVDPWSRRPVPVSLPTSAVALDKSQFPESAVLGASFYLGYQLDTLLMTPLGQDVNQTKTLR